MIDREHVLRLTVAYPDDGPVVVVAAAPEDEPSLSHRYCYCADIRIAVPLPPAYVIAGHALLRYEP